MPPSEQGQTAGGFKKHIGGPRSQNDELHISVSRQDRPPRVGEDIYRKVCCQGIPRQGEGEARSDNPHEGFTGAERPAD